MPDFNLRLLASDKPVYEGPCRYLNMPTSNGMYGVYANHQNTITGIVPGELTFQFPDGKEMHFAVSKGLAKIEEGDVLVLVNSCESPDEIDEIRARRSEEEAERQLKEKHAKFQRQLEEASLARALNRLRIKKKY